MSFFATGFVFGEQPDWNKLRDLMPTLNLLAVRHNEHPLWLLTCNHVFKDLESFPFSPFVEEPLTFSSTSSENRALFYALATAGTAVTGNFEFGQTILRSALEMGAAIQSALSIPTFFFASGDEGLNLAFHIDSSGLRSCKVDGYLGIAELTNQRVTVSPLAMEGDDSDAAESLQEDLEDTSLVDVEPFRVVHEEEREFMYPQSVAIELWPSDWVDPGEALAFGSFDALGDCSSIFETEFVRRGH